MGKSDMVHHKNLIISSKSDVVYHENFSGQTSGKEWSFITVCVLKTIEMCRRNNQANAEVFSHLLCCSIWARI